MWSCLLLQQKNEKYYIWKIIVGNVLKNNTQLWSLLHHGYALAHTLQADSSGGHVLCTCSAWCMPPVQAGGSAPPESIIYHMSLPEPTDHQSLIIPPPPTHLHHGEVLKLKRFNLWLLWIGPVFIRRLSLCQRPFEMPIPPLPPPPTPCFSFTKSEWFHSHFPSRLCGVLCSLAKLFSGRAVPGSEPRLSHAHTSLSSPSPMEMNTDWLVFMGSRRLYTDRRVPTFLFY